MESKPLSLSPEQCQITPAFDLIGTKWMALVIWHLRDGTKRYSELQRALPGISPKTLADRLQTLEDRELAERRVWPQKPPRVEYTLTPRGQALGDILASVAQWVLTG